MKWNETRKHGQEKWDCSTKSKGWGRTRQGRRGWSERALLGDIWAQSPRTEPNEYLGKSVPSEPRDLPNCRDNSKSLFLATKLGDACYTAIDNRKAKWVQHLVQNLPPTQLLPLCWVMSAFCFISKRLIFSGQISRWGSSSNLLRHLPSRAHVPDCAGIQICPTLQCLLNGHHACLPVPSLLRFFKI